MMAPRLEQDRTEGAGGRGIGPRLRRGLSRLVFWLGLAVIGLIGIPVALLALLIVAVRRAVDRILARLERA